MEEERVIFFDPHYCTGCMRCATTCSTYNIGATSLTKSCIHIARHEGHTITRIDEEDDLIFQALSCQTLHGTGNLPSACRVEEAVQSFLKLLRNMQLKHGSTGRTKPRLKPLQAFAYSWRS
jgi:hypothetical protein